MLYNIITIKYDIILHIYGKQDITATQHATSSYQSKGLCHFRHVSDHLDLADRFPK